MNPLPSSSRATNLFNLPNKNKKVYVPNLSASRAPKVKPEENSQLKREEASPSAEKRKPFREKKLLTGAETFAPVLKASSRFVKSKPKLANSTSNSTSNSNSHSPVAVKKESVDRGEPIHGVPQVLTKLYPEKFSRVSSAPPQDLPVSVPRPQLSHPSEQKKPISLLMDLFDPSGNASPIFLFKTPKYLSGVSNDTAQPRANTSKTEVKNERRKCTIHDFPEGRIGTLQIMKSGRLRLLLGECKFWLHRGVRVPFREELAFVDTDAETKTGNIVHLGDIKDRIYVEPESFTAFAIDSVTPPSEADDFVE